ncbi:hypothetical protein GIB67_039722, partial [Kingdonia uniflora]
ILSSPCSPNSTQFFTVIFAVSFELLLLEGVEATVTAQLLLPLWLIYFICCRLCCCYFEVLREGCFNHLQSPSNCHPFPIAAAFFCK